MTENETRSSPGRLCYFLTRKQEGSVGPSKLEFEVSKKESGVIFHYEGKSYLMTRENGIPQVRDYEE